MSDQVLARTVKQHGDYIITVSTNQGLANQTKLAHASFDAEVLQRNIQITLYFQAVPANTKIVFILTEFNSAGSISFIYVMENLL